MAYSNVGVPVFYIDNYLYNKTVGTIINNDSTNKDVYQMKPQIATQVGEDFNIYLPKSPIDYTFSGNMKYYIALLNHNANSNPFSFSLDDGVETNDFLEVYNGINTNSGSSIWESSEAHDTSYYTINTDEFFNVGAISTGIQYTMPHSPDLSLTVGIEFDGIDKNLTSGGGNVANIRYTGNPLWVNGTNRTNPFDVYNNTLNVRTMGARRNGRKSWSLSFSYITDSDFFSSNQRASKYTEHPSDSTYNTSDLNPAVQHNDSVLSYDIDTDDSFFAQVWNKTLGGTLAFTFQPDSKDRDDFYICKFVQDSLDITQNAYKSYSVSLEIVETW